MREPILFVVTGPSGSGKGTIMRAIVKQFPDIVKIATFTTRPPRAKEDPGFDYNFVSTEEFLAKVRQGDIAEWEQVYHDHYYGSPSFDPDCGPDRLMELDYKGMFKYKGVTKRLVSIFIAPPSIAEMVTRIERRSSEANLANRIQNAVDQMGFAEHYDYIILNNDITETTAEAMAIVTAARVERDRLLRLSLLRELCANHSK